MTDVNDVSDLSEVPGVAEMMPLEAAPATSGAARVGTLIAFIASLVAAALIGATAAMMYVNWGLIAEA